MKSIYTGGGWVLYMNILYMGSLLVVSTFRQLIVLPILYAAI